MFNTNILKKVIYANSTNLPLEYRHLVQPLMHAETGTLPLSSDYIRSFLNYYYHITHKDPNSLTSLTLQASFNLAISGHRSWAFFIRNQFAQLGLNLNITQPDNTEVLTRLHDQHIQSLQSNLSCAQGATPSGGSKLRAYRLIKHNVTVCEPYPTMITKPKTRSALTKFRLSDHKLHIESGRHCNPRKLIEEHLCKICNNHEIEDEIHFLLNCSFYFDLRSSLTQLADGLNHSFHNLSPKEKFSFLMCNPHPTLVQENALYIYKAMQATSLCLPIV